MDKNKQEQAELFVLHALNISKDRPHIDPLDYAEMTTVNRKWVSENGEYGEYIIELYKNGVKKRSDHHLDCIARIDQITQRAREGGRNPLDRDGMTEDDKEWIDNNEQYVEMLLGSYDDLMGETVDSENFYGAYAYTEPPRVRKKDLYEY